MMQNPKIRSLHQLLRNSSRKWLVAVDLIDAELLAQVLDRRGFACQVVHTGWVQLHWIANAIWRHCTTCRTDQFSVDIWQQDAHLFEFPVLQRHALECKDTVTTKHQLNRRVTQLSNELHCRKVAWGLGSCRGCHGLRDSRGGCNGLRGCRGLRSCHGLRNCRGISAASLRSRSSNRRRHCRNCFGSWRIGCTSLAIRTTSHWRRSSFAISGGSFASEELSDLWPLQWVVIQGPIGNDDFGPAGNRKKYGCLNWHAQNIKLKHNSFCEFDWCVPWGNATTGTSWANQLQRSGVRPQLVVDAPLGVGTPLQPHIVIDISRSSKQDAKPGWCWCPKWSEPPKTGSLPFHPKNASDRIAEI